MVTQRCVVQQVVILLRSSYPAGGSGSVYLSQPEYLSLSEVETLACGTFWETDYCRVRV